MTINLKLKITIATLLVCSISNFIEAKTKNPAKDLDTPAPVANAKESAQPFREVPYLEHAFIDITPENRKDSIPVGKLGQEGGNKDMIIQFARDIADKKHGNIDSLLILHKGELVFESYFLRGRINLPHPQASTTKAYLSLAIGRAIQLGYLSMADLDKPVISFLKDLDPTRLTRGAESITLHKAMTMTSGVRVTREQREKLREKLPEKLKGQGEIQALLEHSQAISTTTQTFDYKYSDPTMVMQVLDSIVPVSAKDFIKKELLDKMAITEYSWRTGFSGLPSGGSGASMTSRNMLKWGILVRNKGKWNGEQLIPEAFITKASNRIVHMGEDDIFFTGDKVSKPGYGYYFWQADMQTANKSYFTTSAQGGGGQYIILIEELDLIVATTAHKRPDDTMQMTAEKILPAFIH